MPAPAVGRVASLVAVGALALTGCSNTESPVNRRPHTGTASASSVGTVQQVTLEASDDDRFHPSTIVVHPGMVRVVLKNNGNGAPHDFQVTDFPADFVPQTAGGQTQVATFVAPSPGKYQFQCTFHVRQGMVGTMIVLPN